MLPVGGMLDKDQGPCTNYMRFCRRFAELYEVERWRVLVDGAVDRPERAVKRTFRFIVVSV